MPFSKCIFFHFTLIVLLFMHIINVSHPLPPFPPVVQSVKILGEKLVDLELSHSTVSEVLRIFLESHGFELEVCNSLRTKSFQTLCPDIKASILAFLVEELNASNTVIRSVYSCSQTLGLQVFCG